MDSMYGYMDKFDRAYEIIEAVTDNKLIKLNYQFDTLMMEHAENLKAIELKVLTESGTDDDLTTLYLAEAEEVKEKGKGILSKIIDAIRAFINKIKTTIFGKKPDDFPDKVEVDGNPDEVVKEGNAIINAIKNFFSGDHKGLKIAGAGVAAAGTVAAVRLTGSKIASAYKDLSNFVDTGDKALEEAQKAVENADASPEDMNLFKTLLNKLKTKVSKAGSMARALVGPESSKEFHQYRVDKKDWLTAPIRIKKDKWEKFVRAVKDRDLKYVRSCIIASVCIEIGKDYAPTFDAFHKYESYAKEKLPDLYENHDGGKLVDMGGNYIRQIDTEEDNAKKNFSKERIEFLQKLVLKHYKELHPDK